MRNKELTQVIKKLYSVLKLARDHLEYCGYGDRWERECAMTNRLPDKIGDAINIAELVCGKEKVDINATVTQKEKNSP
jgi:hypothetical protein